MQASPPPERHGASRTWRRNNVEQGMEHWPVRTKTTPDLFAGYTSRIYTEGFTVLETQCKYWEGVWIPPLRTVFSSHGSLPVVCLPPWSCSSGPSRRWLGGLQELGRRFSSRSQLDGMQHKVGPLKQTCGCILWVSGAATQGSSRHHSCIFHFPNMWLEGGHCTTCAHNSSARGFGWAVVLI